MEYGQHPIFWVEFFVKYDAVTEVYRFAREPLAHPSTYYGGWKPPLLSEIGAIERKASNSRNQVEAGILQVGFYDFDNFFRNLNRDPVKGAILGYEVVGYMISRAGAKAGAAPTVVHRGFVNSRGLPKGKRAALTSQDAIGAQFGPFAFDKKIPDLLIGAPSFLYAPPAINGKQAIPQVYGSWTDFGTVLRDGTSYVKGRLPLYYVGNFVIASDGTITPVEDMPPVSLLLDPPPAPTYTVVGNPFGGGHTFTFAAIVGTAGGFTTIGAPLTIADLPMNGDRFPVNSYLIFSLARYAAALQVQVTDARLYVKEGDASAPSAWHFIDGFTEAFNLPGDSIFPGETGFQVGAEHGTLPGDSFYKLLNPLPTTNTATITVDLGGGVTGQRYRGFLAGRGYVKIDQLYASPVNADQTLGEGRVEVPLTSSDFVRPGHANWPLASPVVTNNGVDFTMVFGFGPRADFAVDGRLTAAFNGCGYTQDGTANTEMIGDPYDQMVRLLNDFVFYNGGKGYKSGPWPALETFPGSTTVQMVNVGSWQACSAYYEAKLGRKPKGNIYLNQQVSFREILRQAAEDFGIFIYTDKFGRVSAGVINETVSLTNAVRLRDRVEIISAGAPTFDEPGLRNKHDYVFDYDPDLGQFRLAPRLLLDTGSIDFYRREVPGPGIREFKFTHDEPFVTAVMDHDKMVMARTPVLYPFKVNYTPALNLDINQVVVVTNEEHDLVERAMLILGWQLHEPVKDTGVTVTCLDIQDLLAV